MDKKLRIIVPVLLITLCSCAFLLPSSKKTVKSPWGTFHEAKAAFDEIIPYRTTTDELKKIGFDPFHSANIEIITHLDIIQRFMENPSIKKEDLDQGLQDCIEAKDLCRAYAVALTKVKRKRYGNFLLDIFKFKRKRKETGWEFKALIVMRDGLVIYKIWGGRPMIDQTEEKKNPLGLLQEGAEPLFDTLRGGI